MWAFGGLDSEAHTPFATSSRVLLPPAQFEILSSHRHNESFLPL